MKTFSGAPKNARASSHADCPHLTVVCREKCSDTIMRFHCTAIQTSSNIAGASTERCRERCIVSGNGSLKQDYALINTFASMAVTNPHEGKCTKSCIVSSKPREITSRFWKAFLRFFCFYRWKTRCETSQHVGTCCVTHFTLLMHLRKAW